MAKTVFEDETKYDVADEAPTPVLDGLPTVAQVPEPVTQVLDAVYFDTQDLALGRAGITLRRRTGGDDEGWHLKLPHAQGREEVRLPLSRGVRQPPAALRRIVLGVTGDVPLEPVLTISTERREQTLLGKDDEPLATFCDDRVRAVQPGPDGEVEQVWREWEVESHAPSKKLRKALSATIGNAGASSSKHRSKPARALTLPPPPEVPDVMTTVTKRTGERELVQSHLTALVDTLQRLDPLVRANAPDAVHQMRVTCRRLRSIMVAFERRFDSSSPEVASEVKWLGQVLGRARDMEVLQEHLEVMMAELPPELRHRPGRWVHTRLRQAHREAHQDAVAEMSTERYLTLMSTLDGWAVRAPWRKGKDRPARERAGKALDRAWRDLGRAAEEAAAAEGTPEHTARLHDVRKAAKSARYAADVVRPATGKRADRLGRAAKGVHGTLGEHRDDIVAREVLLELADIARERGEDAFGLGILYARCGEQAAAHERQYEQLWKKARRLT
jgi:CHAD domain-containing protein